MNITLIASDNGLGHIKRIIFLSNILVLKNNVILMAPKNKVKKFKLNKKIKVENYEMEIDIKKNSYNYNWIKNINDKILNKTDLFISDNLPEILSLEQNSFLYANSYLFANLSFVLYFVIIVEFKKETLFTPEVNLFFVVDLFEKFNLSGFELKLIFLYLIVSF